MVKQLKPSHFIQLKWQKYRRQIAGGLLIIAGLNALGLVFLGSLSDVISTSPPVTDLISGQDWAHMAGATPTAEGIQIQPLGRAIVNQDGTDNQTNPPVNVRGPHLSFSGDITLNYKVSQVPAQGTASIYLYSAVPVIYDEWRYQPALLRIDLSQQKVVVYGWNGRSDSPSLTKSWSYPVDSGAYVTINLGKKNQKITIEVNGVQLGNIKTKRLFSSGNLWFGADASLNSQGWLLKSLNVAALSGKFKLIAAPDLVMSNSDTQTLRKFADNNSRKLPIGAAITSYGLFSDKAYRQLVASQINMLVPENELKAQFVHPQPNVYSFTEADNLVDFALANGMTVHGHNLVFSEANPKWMQRVPIADRQQIMTDHITTVVSHYGGKINEWDVVDEPLNDNDDNHGNSSDLRPNIWLSAMGESYIDIAFKAAHDASPSAKLYLNEYGLEADGSRWDEFLSLIKRLQARGVPIDGVGFQAHVHEANDEIDTTTLKNHMQILAGMGLKSRVSELDVYGDDAQHQADQYRAVLKACLYSPSCTSFTMWGLTDKYGSTTDIHNYPLNYGNDLVWDENMQPKTAYQSLQNTLKSL
ncbi:endo-1,4-beta-xylanase [Candidatus Saccharibacteria bacterium]|nr:endo-1,4-beta-xylanase [Candidatus Saccharibacteria bacterium]